MSSVLQSDIFFFISSVCLVFITIAIIVALIYIIKILKDLRGFLRAVRSGTDALSEDLSEVRTKLREKNIMTGLLLSLITAVIGFSEKAKERRTRRKKGEQK